MSFQHKVAIVTGAGQGIGKEICKQLIAAGAFVLLNDINPELTESTAKELGVQAIGMAGDSSDLSLIQSLVEKAKNDFGRLDLVVANAGITLFGDFLTYQPEAFNKVMQVNLFGTFFLVQAAVTVMKNQATGGSILLMSSVTGHQAHKNLAAYSMSKAALEMLAKNLVVEISSYKININTVAPGATATERTLADDSYETTWSQITPMGRPASVGDIAQTSLFLLSDAARHITGQSIVVDGGWSAISPSPY